MTTDVPLTFTVVGAAAALWAAWSTGRTRWVVVAAGFVGLSMATKFSAFSYAPVWALLAVLPSGARPLRTGLRHLGILVLASFAFTELILIIAYGFSFDWTTIRSLGMSGRGVRPEDMSLLRRLPYEVLATVPWPSPDFAKGMKDIVLYTEAGHPVYLLGMRSDTGWWWSPLVMLAVKTPLALLALAGTATVLAVRFPRHRGRELVFLLAPAALVLGTNVAANLGLGVRHLMPMFPFLMILAGWPLRGAGFRAGGVLVRADRVRAALPRRRHAPRPPALPSVLQPARAGEGRRKARAGRLEPGLGTGSLRDGEGPAREGRGGRDPLLLRDGQPVRGGARVADPAARAPPQTARSLGGASDRGVRSGSR